MHRAGRVVEGRERLIIMKLLNEKEQTEDYKHFHRSGLLDAGQRGATQFI